MKIALIGAGNLAWNLASALKGSEFEIVQVFSRHLDSAGRIARDFPNIAVGMGPSNLRKDLDLVIVASTDHGIGEIARVYAPHLGHGIVVAHTAGSVAMSELAPFGENIGVFYPLQTFTRGLATDFRTVPIFLEGADAVLERLRPLADHLSSRVEVMDSQQRLQLHLGAVFASNFSNYMWLIAEDIVRGAGTSGLDVYAPLIRECMEKALRHGPFAAQTGPARRGDDLTMDKHLDILHERDERLERLYRELSQMIATRFAQPEE
ncbi:MAG: DUF2520 domain-containing protein [Bacteroidia bacterium]